jgi:CBS domain-containing protein
MAERNEEAGHGLVASIMTREVEVVGPETPLSEVRGLFAVQALHHLPVVIGEQLVGLISFNDLVRVGMDPNRPVQPRPSVANLQARHVMQERPMVVTASEDMTVRQAAAMLSEGHFHSLPVVDADNRLLGVVTSTDLIQHLCDLLESGAESHPQRIQLP